MDKHVSYKCSCAFLTPLQFNSLSVGDFEVVTMWHTIWSVDSFFCRLPGYAFPRFLNKLHPCPARVLENK